jgi:hypothetical protein
VDAHERHQPSVEDVARPEAQRDGRQQRDADRAERAGHRGQRGHEEDDPRHRGTAAADEVRGPVDDALRGPVRHRDAEEVRHADEQHEQVRGEARVHVVEALALEDRPDDERHDERDRTEVHGPGGPDDEDKWVHGRP